MTEHKKKDRQNILKKIISQQEIGDQPQLLKVIKDLGIEATQATISRDLQEMGVTKVRIKPGIYKYEVIEKISEEAIWDKLKVLFANFVFDIKRTGNLILLKTSPGNATGIASFIDRLERDDILGTVAGDDTILVVVSAEDKTGIVENEFLKLINESRIEDIDY